MTEDKTSVAILKIADFESEYQAILKGLELINFNFESVQGQNILLKPNCLQAAVDAITSPKILGYTAKIMKENGAIVNIGDSPMSGGKTAEQIYTKTKLLDIINELGENPNWISFMENPLKVEETYFKLMEKTVVSKDFLNKDLVINLPRYKTHFLTTFTGAIKNFWGIQVGTTKSKSHIYGKTAKAFGTVLTDLFQYVMNMKKSNLIIMDAIKIMHGRGGPAFGSMMDLGLIIIGTDAVAIDSVCVKIAGYNVKNIYYLGECSERGLGISDLNKIEILGTQINEIKPPSKIIFPGGSMTGMIGMVQDIGMRFMKEIPYLRKTKCKKCSQCAKLCPAQCITMDEITGYPKFNRKDCINCLCCVEGCPEHALRPRRVGLLGALGLN